MKEIKTGTILSGCEVIENIGEGGMGAVYKATDNKLERQVAIKFMNPDVATDANKTRFLREAAAMARFSHPGIGQIYSFGEYEGSAYFVMEFIEGRSLDVFLTRARMIIGGTYPLEELKASGALSMDPGLPYFMRDQETNPVFNSGHYAEVNKLIRTVAEALAVAHEAGIIHRDLKPSNIIVTKNGGYKLIDFGLAKRFGEATSSPSNVTKTQQIIGTLNYMAPEQFMGKKGIVGPTTDVYSLGVIYYELLTLKHPVDEEDVSGIIRSITQREPVVPRKVNFRISSRTNEIVLKCLEKDISKRYRNAGELVENLTDQHESRQLFAGLKSVIFDLMGSSRKASETITTPKQSKILHKELSNSARELYEAARKEYYIDFKFYEATEKLKQALELDSGLADAYYLLVACGSHIGGKKLMDDIFKSFEKAKSIIDPAQRQKAIDKMNLAYGYHVEQNYREMYRTSYKLRRTYPDDYDILLMDTVLVVINESPDIVKIRKTLDAFIKAQPDYNLAYLYAADMLFEYGDPQEAIKILTERVGMFPHLSNLNLLRFNYLISTGRLDEVEIEINKVVRNDPSNEFGPLYQIQLGILKNDIKEVQRSIKAVISLAKGDAIKKGMYYMLYETYHNQGDKEKANKYLKLAGEIDLGFDNKTLSIEEKEKKLIEMDLTGLRPDEICAESMKEFTKHAKLVAKKNSDKVIINKRNTRTHCFEITETGSCVYGIIFEGYTYALLDEKRNSLFLQSVPILPFVDSDGDILKVNYRRCETGYSKYLAEVEYKKPRPRGERTFLFAGFDSQGVFEDIGDELVFRTPEIFAQEFVLNGVAVSVPKVYRVEEVLPADLVTTELEDVVIYTHKKLMFKHEKYPEIRLKLKRKV